MTTTQTIDGVTELLARLESLDVDGYQGWAFEAADKLRALLDAPAKDYVLINGMHFSNAEILEWREKACADIEKAAQPQGEPVAWQYRVSAGPQTGWSLWHDGKGEEFKQSYQVETRPIYAEQPAPVAKIGLSTGDVTTAIHSVTGFPGVTGDHVRRLAWLLNESLSPSTERGEPYAYEYEFATMLYGDGPGKFKKVLTQEAPDQHEIDAGCIINVKPLYSHEPRKYDDTLLPFLALMRKELHANSHKGDREGWLGMTSNQALLEVSHHVKKLEKAEGLPQAAEYAADVANCCMMLLDTAGGLESA